MDGTAVTPSVLVGVVSAITAAGSFWFATRAARATARSSAYAVDAGAYKRATGIYESSITSLRRDLSTCRTEARDLRAQLIEAENQSARLLEMLKNQSP